MTDATNPAGVTDATNPPEVSNTAALQRLCVGGINGRDLSVVDEVVHPHVAFHALMPGLAPGSEGLKELLRGLQQGFGDFNVAIQDIVASGNKVVGRFANTGTNDGVLFGSEPTGRKVAFSEIAILRFDAGKIVEIWSIPDRLAIVEQLGSAPAGDPG